MTKVGIILVNELGLERDLTVHIFYPILFLFGVLSYNHQA